MRARNIKPGFFQNEDLAEVSVWARLMFIGLWMLADREGRLEDRPRRIKYQLFPVDDVDLDPELNALQEWGFIQRYEVDGQRYIQILNFEKHQRPHQNEKESVIPPPVDAIEESVSHHGTKSGEPRAQALGSDSLNPDSLNDKSILSCADASANGASEPEKPQRKRKPDPYWDAMVQVMGYQPETKSERGRWNKAVAELREIGAYPTEIPVRAANYRARWPDMDLTPTAISGNWSKLKHPPQSDRASPRYEDVTGTVHDDPERPP